MQRNTWQNHLFELYFLNTYDYGRGFVQVEKRREGICAGGKKMGGDLCRWKKDGRGFVRTSCLNTLMYKDSGSTN